MGRVAIINLHDQHASNSSPKSCKSPLSMPSQCLSYFAVQRVELVMTCSLDLTENQRLAKLAKF